MKYDYVFLKNTLSLCIQSKCHEQEHQILELKDYCCKNNRIKREKIPFIYSEVAINICKHFYCAAFKIVCTQRATFFLINEFNIQFGAYANYNWKVLF